MVGEKRKISVEFCAQRSAGTDRQSPRVWQSGQMRRIGKVHVFGAGQNSVCTGTALLVSSVRVSRSSTVPPNFRPK